MEAALEVVGDLSDIGNVDVLVGLIILDELEVHFLGEEELQEEVHQLGVFLKLEEVVGEHGHTTADHQLSSRLLVLVNCADRPIAGIGKRP